MLKYGNTSSLKKEKNIKEEKKNNPIHLKDY